MVKSLFVYRSTKHQTQTPILVAQGVLQNVDVLKPHISPSKPVVIVTHDHLVDLHASALKNTLVSAGYTVHLFAFPKGEKHKNRRTKEWIEDEMLMKGLGRNTQLIALGGGVVTDIGGYVAATYCRGISFISIPTTLLAMVDAALGGKNGINVPQGKNLIGSFYQPKAILMETETLKTLPVQEMRNGVVEMIKHGFIADARYFSRMEKNVDRLLNKEASVLKSLILGSCRIKLAFVKKDEFDAGFRAFLNFGHTVGHALEHVTDYKISHGEAVAIGMLVESKIAVDEGILPTFALNRLYHVLKRYGVPLKIPSNISSDLCLEAMRMDKKSVEGIPHLPMMQDIGCPAAQRSQAVRLSSMKHALDWIMNDLCLA